MSTVAEFVRSLVQMDGAAVNVDSGLPPCVLAPAGQFEIRAEAATMDEIHGLVATLLPANARQTLERLGAIEWELPVSPELPGERFFLSVVRAGANVFFEIRRHQGGPP